MNRPWPHIETERLVLELARKGMEERILDYYRRNKAHLGPWEPQRGAEFVTLAWWRRQTAANEREFQDGRGARLLIMHNQDSTGAVIGVANLSNIVRGAFHAAHVGYSIDAEYEGQGFMREALEGLIAYAFDELGLHRIMANYQPQNLRSEGLLQRLGFEREGYAKSYLRIDGEWCDHVLTALVNPRGGG